MICEGYLHTVEYKSHKYLSNVYENFKGMMSSAIIEDNESNYSFTNLYKYRYS